MQHLRSIGVDVARGGSSAASSAAAFLSSHLRLMALQQPRPPTAKKPDVRPSTAGRQTVLSRTAGLAQTSKETVGAPRVPSLALDGLRLALSDATPRDEVQR
jgi:hypothetical protein